MKAHHHGFFAMGTRFDLVLTGMEKPEGEMLAQELKDECQRIESLLSIHDPTSPLSLINHRARTGRVPVNEELQKIFSQIGYYHRLTEGYFDPTLGSEAGISVGWKGVELLKDEVQFIDPLLRIDPGGYGKGYAVELLVNMLREAKVEHALLSFGDSLIYGLGTHPHGDGWPISLPLSGEKEPNGFVLRDQALSISGNTFNNQKKFANSGHIVDATSGLCRTENGVVCVMCENPVEAEIFSTAFFGAGPEKGKMLEKARIGLQVKWFID